MITTVEVKKIAELVKTPLSEAELEKLAIMFSETLKHIEVLKELDTSTTQETYQVNGLTNVFQTDQNNVTLSQEEALKNAKEVLKGLIATKAVFDR